MGEQPSKEGKDKICLFGLEIDTEFILDFVWTFFIFVFVLSNKNQANFRPTKCLLIEPCRKQEISREKKKERKKIEPQITFM